MTTVTEGEVYPNAPVVLVAMEIRHPTTTALSHDQQLAVKRRLASYAPIMRTGQLITQYATAQTPGAPAAPPPYVEEYPRYVSRDSTLAVSFRSEAVVIETTRYMGWERLLALVSQVLTARAEVGGLDGVERVGLRYVDEIRVPGEADGDWASWVDFTLLGPSLIGEELDLGPAQWQGVTVFESAPGRALALRFGPREGFAVDPAGELKRFGPTQGAFFLLDIDSFWVPMGEVPEFDVETLLTTCEELHAPVRKLFERLITDRLREKVLRRAD